MFDITIIINVIIIIIPEYMLHAYSNKMLNLSTTIRFILKKFIGKIIETLIKSKKTNKQKNP